MQSLGYHDGYVAQGGDWGALVTHGMGALHPESCHAVHMNMLVGVNPQADLTKLTEADQVIRASTM